MSEQSHKSGILKEFSTQDGLVMIVCLAFQVKPGFPSHDDSVLSLFTVV